MPLTDIQTDFNENGYLLLQNLLTVEECAKLSTSLFILKAENKMIRDALCPVSDAVYKADCFTDLHNRLAAPLSEVCGKQLVPTFNYARIYYHGEELPIHTDRAACEYSATITLNHAKNSHIWPIYFMVKNEEVPAILNIGEMIFYKGLEMEHFRKPYDGEWQTQLFVHYVDKNGPHAAHANDEINESQKPQEQTCDSVA